MRSFHSTLSRTAAALALAIASVTGAAATPLLIGYQGAVFDDQGMPLAGLADVDVAIYDAASGGNVLYTESHPGLPLVDGAFDLEVGAGSSQSGSLDENTFAGDETWLELTVDGEVLGPRQRLVSVPYALRAAVAERIDGVIGTVPRAIEADALYAHVEGTASGDQSILLRVNTQEDGTPEGDLEGVSTYYDEHYFNLYGDALVFEKTDTNATAPDGGIVFAHRGSDGILENDLVIRKSYVGIGTSTPNHPLDVEANVGAGGSGVRLRNFGAGLGVEIVGNGSKGEDPALRVTNDNTDRGVAARFFNSSTYASTYVHNSGTGEGLYVSNYGSNNENASIWANNHNTSSGIAGYFTNNSGNATTHFQNDGSGSVLWLESSGGPFIIGVDENNATSFWIDGTGMAHVRALEILGGSDLSERFDVAATPDAPVEPGTVVSIDAENPGQLAVSVSPYDTAVAGIVAGAGGVEPGMLMAQRGNPLVDGEHPVALSGRVYAKADVAGGPIRPGDLLTTSERAGHAMRVADRDRADGAILGKAMTGLDEGTGLVLVLVNLQ
jgi:hypothetical protein